MRIGVVGAGSIGGFLAARFALAGAKVTVVARGASFDAIRSDGLRLTLADGTEHQAKVSRVVRDPADAGHQDIVVLGVKAHQVAPIAADLHYLMGPETALIPMQNGIPWWYFQRCAGPFEGRHIESVDPDGTLMRTVDPQRIIGCVVYPACQLAAPGHVRHVEGDRFPLGELDGVETARVRRVSELFAQAGLKAPVIGDIRNEIWVKLWGNLTFNPISALSHSTLADICQFDLSRQLAASMMREAESVARSLGVSFRVSLEKRIAGAEKVGRHKTSMLQDVESGRDPETDALVGSVIELGRLTGTPTPHIETVYALMKLLGHRIASDKVFIRASASPVHAERQAA